MRVAARAHPKLTIEPKCRRGILMSCVDAGSDVSHKDVQRADRITKILYHVPSSSWPPPLFPGRAQVALIKLRHRPDGCLAGAGIK